MAVTVTRQGTAKPPGAEFEVPCTLTLDSSYPNPSGYVLTPATFGLSAIRRIGNIEAQSLAAAATWTYWVVPTYGFDGFISSFALHLAVVSTGVEVANAVNVSTAVYNVVIEGF